MEPPARATDPASPESALPPGTILDRRYRIESRLGAGGMGGAYLARNLRADLQVVVKVPHPELAQQPAFAQRFSREISHLTQLDHPHIVTVHDAGFHDDLPFVVVQYLAGGSLGDHLRARDTPQSGEEVARWLRPVADALDFVHACGVVHRDLKPDNILFDRHGHVYISDFGIAKSLVSDPSESATLLDAAAPDTTQLGMFLGSPRYSAPEYIHRRFGPAGDQYSLAVTVYLALSGAYPHEGHTGEQLLVEKATEPPQPIERVVPDLPRAAAATVMRALAHDPEQRFASCGEFAAAFEAGLEAVPSPPTERASGAPRARSHGTLTDTTEAGPRRPGSEPMRKTDRARPGGARALRFLALGIGLVGLIGVGLGLERLLRDDALSVGSSSRAGSTREEAERRFEQALGAARSIEAADRRDAALRAIAEEQARAGHPAAGAETARQIDDRALRGRALAAVARRAAALGQPEAAEALARELSDPAARAAALRAAALARARAGQSERALDLVDRIRDDLQGRLDRGALRVLRELPHTLALAGAETEARLLAQSLAPHDPRGIAFARLAQGLAEAGNPSAAREAAGRVPEMDLRIDALCSLGIEQARDGDAAGARATFADARSLVGEQAQKGRRANALHTIADSETQADLRDDARTTLAQALADLSHAPAGTRAPDYIELALTQIALDELQGARGTIELLLAEAQAAPNDEERDYARRLAGLAQAAMGDSDAAERTAARLDPDGREAIYARIAVQRASAGDFPAADRALDAIEDPVPRARARAATGRIAAEASSASQAP